MPSIRATCPDAIPRASRCGGLAALLQLVLLTIVWSSGDGVAPDEMLKRTRELGKQSSTRLSSVRVHTCALGSAARVCRGQKMQTLLIEVGSQRNAGHR
jgi:hypothetical protein